MREVNELLRTLEGEDVPVDVQAAYSRYRAETIGRKPQRRFVLPRPYMGAFAAVMLVGVLIALTPVRTLGQRFLEMLRVQKLAVIRLGDNGLIAEGPNGRRGALAQLIADNMTVTMNPGPGVTVPDLAAARAGVGFHVESLQGNGAPSIKMTDQVAFHITLDADKIRAVLEESGRSDVPVPNAITGSTLAFHVGKGIKLNYGNCGANAAPKDESCIAFVQIPAPNISVPPNLDMAALAESALQISGLSAQDAARVAHTIDWSTTLVIPIPDQGASSQNVLVDGENGVLIELARSSAYELIWLKNGVIHMINGSGNPSRALAAAGSLG